MGGPIGAGPMGGCTPLIPTSAPSAATKNDWDSLDPLAMLNTPAPASKATKKPPATRTTGGSGDWDNYNNIDIHDMMEFGATPQLSDSDAAEAELMDMILSVLE